jgi:hypothetical protein
LPLPFVRLLLLIDYTSRNTDTLFYPSQDPPPELRVFARLLNVKGTCCTYQIPDDCFISQLVTVLTDYGDCWQQMD